MSRRSQSLTRSRSFRSCRNRPTPLLLHVGTTPIVHQSRNSPESVVTANPIAAMTDAGELCASSFLPISHHRRFRFQPIKNPFPDSTTKTGEIASKGFHSKIACATVSSTSLSHVLGQFIRWLSALLHRSSRSKCVFSPLPSIKVGFRAYF
jgi:hypothetical protein